MQGHGYREGQDGTLYESPGVRFKSLKAKYSRSGLVEPIEDEEETEATKTTYKSPVV